MFFFGWEALVALWNKTAEELIALLASRQISSEELTRSVLERIDAVEEKVRAFQTLRAEKALDAARLVDGRRANGETLHPLAGIPIALKDNMCTQGIETTCSSKILSGFVPPYDGTVVQKVKDAGMVCVGKTNLDEFAMGSSTENSGFEPTRNPWDLERIPGGSSGGSAAAVAACEAVVALGSDTGGSIRQPAALCGVVGLKPTYGRVSRYGLIAFASSLDQIGPFARSVSDCARLLEVIAGEDPNDSTSAPVPVHGCVECLKGGVKDWLIGVPKEYFIEGMDAEVRESVESALKTYESMGAQIEEISLPHTDYAVAVYYLLATAEASSNLARYDGVGYGHRTDRSGNIVEMMSRSRSEGFGDEVKRRIMLGTYVLSAGFYDAYYLKAQKVRTLIKKDFDKAFERCDVVITPTSPTPAFKRGERTHDPLQMYLSDIFTISANLAGLPAVSLPCGFTQSGLPIGLQIIGKVFDEPRLLRAAYAFEEATPFHQRQPDL